MAGTWIKCALMSLLMGELWAYKWIDAPNGIVPKEAYQFEYYQKIHYFCEAIDDSGKVQTGTLIKSEDFCSYVNVKSEKVLRSKKFQVLALEPKEKGVWQHSEKVTPPKAVPCDEKESQECYLGVSFYGDGLCQEAPGKIFLKRQKIFMHIGTDLHICPHFSYLTVV